MNRYLLPDGHASLYVVLNGADEVTGWSSLNAARLPPLNGMAYVLQPEVGIYLMENYPQILRDRQDWAIYRVSTRHLSTDGSIRQQEAVHLLSPQGLYLVAISIPAESSNLIFNPPALVLPENLPTADPWTSQGTIGDFSYSFNGLVVGRQTIDSEIGPLAGCVQVESRLELSQDNQVFFSQVSTDWLCPGVGTAEWLVTPSAGEVEHARLLSSSLRPSHASNPALFPSSGTLSTTPVSVSDSDPQTWSLLRVGDVDVIGTNTLSPGWAYGDPALIFAAHTLGEMVALQASGDQTGTPAWKVYTGASVFGQPAYDLPTGLVFFGASNKMLYAFDRNGLFRWAFQAMDNLPSHPLVVEGQVIAGSEDGWVYALDSETGTLNWKGRAGTSLASAPAWFGDSVVFGNDDGSLYAFRLANGELTWTFTTSGAVDAPLVVDGSTLFVATRDGHLFALDESGRQLWDSFLGNTLHTAPVVTDSTVFIVDELGKLFAVDRTDGSRLWQAPSENHLGPPGRAEEGVFVVTDKGRIVLYDSRGQQSDPGWDLCDLQPEDRPCDPLQPLGFYSGPYPGDGAYWLADEARGLYRLGP